MCLTMGDLHRKYCDMLNMHLLETQGVAGLQILANLLPMHGTITPARGECTQRPAT